MKQEAIASKIKPYEIITIHLLILQQGVLSLRKFKLSLLALFTVVKQTNHAPLQQRPLPRRLNGQICH